MTQTITEFEKLAPIVTPIVTLIYTIGIAAYLNYQKSKKDKILTEEEMNFILSRGEADDPLNCHLPVQRESQLIEKTYGFYATREQFNYLSNLLKPEGYKLTELRKIKNYIRFKGDKPKIKMESGDYFVFYVNVFFILTSSFIAIHQFYKYIREDWAVFTFLPATALIFMSVHFFLGPYWQAKKIKEVLETNCKPK